MRTPFTLAASLAATALFVPFATSAEAVTTTSTQVIYQADPDDDGNFELYTMPADGSADGTLLFATTTDNGDPAISPDAATVAYTALDTSDFTYHLYTRPSNGSGSATKVTTGADDFNSAWSRDGSTLAFTRYDTFPPSVYTMPAAGGTATKVASAADDAGFSPSGRQLVVDHLSAAGAPLYLELVTLGTTVTRAKITGTDSGLDAMFSPDGQTILFVKYGAGCETQLMSVPVAGGTATTLYSAANHAVESPEFSEDGTQIFWGDYLCDAIVEDVYVANANGSSPTAIRSTTAVEEFPTVGGGTTATLETTAPASPVVSAAHTFGPTSATISWTETDTDVGEYVVIKKNSGDPAPTSPSDGAVVYDGAAHSATVTGLTSGTTYDLYVFAYDASGNASASPSAVHSVTPYTSPIVTPIGTVSSVSYNTTFTLAWHGSNAPAFRILQGERHKASNGTWGPVVYTTAVSSQAATSKTITGTQGHSYAYKVIALDADGNTGGSGSTWADEPLNENYAAIVYSAGWTAVASGPRWMTSYRFTNTAGRTASLKSETERFQVIGDRCSGCGQFRVYVDGVLKATIDTYSSTTKTRQILYTSGVYSGGPKYHTIKIVILGTAGRGRVDLDAIGLLRR